MKRLKALIDLYSSGQMIRRGQTFMATDNEARLLIRDGKAMLAPEHPAAVSERRTKIVEGKGKK